MLTPPLLDNYMTIEETARLLNRSRESVYTAVRRGRLNPIKHRRRNFFERDEVMLYQRHLRERFPSKEEALRLYERFPHLPHNDAGVAICEQRAWDIFEAYASNHPATYETVGSEFAITKQRVAQVVSTVIERLLAIETL